MSLERLRASLSDRYRIERELGQGGMATVYLAEDLKHDRKVALKVLKPELAAVLGAERFVVEIKTTAALQHPHILPLFDSGTADGFLFYVMPFIDGETLRAKLDREAQLGIEESVRIATEVGEALHHAHQHGVIHRDIKPENILLQDGRPMVADFGIALAVSAAAGGRMTETGLSLGTPHYMSPEQATAEREISARSDVYSLGSVLYEMLTGSPPHVGATAQQIIMKIVTEEAAPVTKVRKAVPANIAAAVAKSLQKLPADRFESAKAFVEALHNASFTVAGTISGFETAGAGGGRGRGVSRNAFLGVAALAVVLLGTTLFLALRPSVAPQVRRYSVVLPLLRTREGGVQRRILMTPDGKTLVYIGADARLWVRPLDALEARPLEGTANAYSPFFSPDGSQIGYLVPGRVGIRTIPLSGGPTLAVADSGIGSWGGSWSSDGFIYASSSVPTANGIVRVPAGGGRPAEVVTVLDRDAGETAHIFPEALPGGKGILFTVQRGGSTATNDIAVAVPGSGSHTILARGVSARYAASGHLLFVTSEGALMAAPLDLDQLALSGSAVPILQGLPSPGAFGEVDLALSGDGTLWYVSGNVDFLVEPVWVSRGGEATVIQEGWKGDIGYPALSPDGTRLAYSVPDPAGSDIQLWVKRLGQATQTIFTREGGVNFRPSWSADGRQIAFISDRGPNYDVLVKPADQGAREMLLFGQASEQPVWEVVYPRSGPWILFRVEDRGSDIYAIRPGVDSVATPLVVTDAVERMPTLSPDGRWLAYVSNTTGRAEVYVRPFPEVNAAVWQVSTTGGSEPRWAHSGRELFFRTDARQLVSVPVTAGETFAWGEPQPLFSLENYRSADNGRMWDLAPGDQRFLMLRIVPSEVPTELIVVENFFEELRAKVRR